MLLVSGLSFFFVSFVCEPFPTDAVSAPFPTDAVSASVPAPTLVCNSAAILNAVRNFFHRAVEENEVSVHTGPTTRGGELSSH